MKESDFVSGFPGRLIPTTLTEYRNGVGEEPMRVKTIAYVPNPLPPKLDWQAIKLEHFDRYHATVAVLSKLNGLHTRVGNAAGLLRTLWMREAKLSSEIEDIHTTAEELVLAGSGRSFDVEEGGHESWNYVRALEHGVHSELPWSIRVICEMHRLLLSGVRGRNKCPGELRNKGVYIGDRRRGAEKARFVPMPPGNGLRDALSQLEIFVNSQHDVIPPLFVVALTHYQFETIHPFNDGNGRIGRVLISRSLVKEGLLEHPVVYMSAYINEHRREYVDLLLRISREGGDAWSHWIGFILEAIRTQALDAIWRSEELIALRDGYFLRLRESKKAPTCLFEVVERLFEMPTIDIQSMMQQTNVVKTTAGKYIDRLVDLGILEERTGRERHRNWLAPEIVDVIVKEAPVIES